jgi:hypothetical protein
MVVGSRDIESFESDEYVFVESLFIFSASGAPDSVTLLPRSDPFTWNPWVV